MVLESADVFFDAFIGGSGDRFLESLLIALHFFELIAYRCVTPVILILLLLSLFTYPAIFDQFCHLFLQVADGIILHGALRF